MPRVYYHGQLKDFEGADKDPTIAVREVQVGGRVITWLPRFTVYRKLKNVVRQTFKDRYGNLRQSIGDKWDLVSKTEGPAVYWQDISEEEWDHAQLNRYNRDKLLRLEKPELTLAEKKAELARLQAEIEACDAVPDAQPTEKKLHWKQRKAIENAQTSAELAAG